ncbi:uncharacterized protein LOC144451728 [Glandiceps talaboti]
MATSIAAKEVREGITYQQDIGLSESYQTDEIPEPIKAPKQVPIDLGQYTPVIFDIETNSAYSTAEIIQLSARYDQHQFEKYILPRQPIPQIVSEKTHFTIDTSLLDQFLTTVAGFVDSLPLFQSILPGRNSYSQESLANDYIGQIYDAHNATADVIMLQRLIETCNVSLSTLLENSFT